MPTRLKRMVPSSDLVHLHLLLNHFPTVGMIVGFGVFLLALVKKSEDLKRGGLAVMFVIALLSLPTYMTGYSAQKAVRGMAGVSQGVVNLHQRSALMALIFMRLSTSSNARRVSPVIDRVCSSKLFFRNVSMWLL